ncbi:putative exported protein [Plasmodium gaboni]|uniref:Putative exported protein n=1 Tax=Plasmodium gaboni TaxID=647221 RepID=A0A151LL96_9APIC|nr:putative exported protein [Plasmodium gaboni]KYN99755.1 putative exported protein [Plasmodium gaboni]
MKLKNNYSIKGNISKLYDKKEKAKYLFLRKCINLNRYKNKILISAFFTFILELFIYIFCTYIFVYPNQCKFGNFSNKNTIVPLKSTFNIYRCLNENMKQFEEPYEDISYNVDSYNNYNYTKAQYTDEIHNYYYKEETDNVQYNENPYINTHYHIPYEEVPNLIKNYNYVHENYNMNDENLPYMERHHDIQYNGNKIYLDAFHNKQYLEPHNNNNNKTYHSRLNSDPYFNIEYVNEEYIHLFYDMLYNNNQFIYDFYDLENVHNNIVELPIKDNIHEYQEKIPYNINTYDESDEIHSCDFTDYKKEEKNISIKKLMDEQIRHKINDTMDKHKCTKINKNVEEHEKLNDEENYNMYEKNTSLLRQELEDNFNVFLDKYIKMKNLQKELELIDNDIKLKQYKLYLADFIGLDISNIDEKWSFTQRKESIRELINSYIKQEELNMMKKLLGAKNHYKKTYYDSLCITHKNIKKIKKKNKIKLGVSFALTTATSLLTMFISYWTSPCVFPGIFYLVKTVFLPSY